MKELEHLRLALNTVSELYISMHVLDLEEGIYSTIKTNEYIEKWSAECEGLQAIMNNIMTHLARPETTQTILRFVDLSTLPKRLADRKVITEIFCGKVNGWCNAKFIRVGDEGPLRYVMCIVENVDAQTREMEDAKKKVEESAKLQPVMDALIEDYSTVCSVDRKNDTVELLKLHPRIAAMYPETPRYNVYSVTMERYIQMAVHPEDRELLTTQVSEEVMDAHFAERPSYSVTYRNNEGRYGELKVVRTGNGQFLMDFADMSEQIEELNHKIYEDSLTKVENRKFYDERLRDKDFAAVAMIDVDHFKGVNDTFGHACGDAALEAVAGVIKSCVRSEDHVVRYGGDEFVLVFPEMPQDVFYDKLELMRQKTTEVRLEEYPELRLSLSIGASYGHGLVKERLQAADEALYESKKTRNTVTILWG